MIKTGLYKCDDFYYVVIGIAWDINTKRDVVVFHPDGEGEKLWTKNVEDFNMTLITEIVFNKREYRKMIF